MIPRTLSPLLLVGVFVLTWCTLSEGQDCVNGDVLVDGTCQCFSGWIGNSCSRCGGRVRLNSSSGVITDHIGGGNYSSDSQCLFYIEPDSNASSVRLTLHSFFTECQWDYLYIFDGDSVYSTKLAAFTGNLIDVPLPTPASNDNDTMENNTTESDAGSGSEITPFEEPTEVTLTASGAGAVLYFYSDAGVNAPGFNLSYWVSYECPDNCSGQGVCQDGVCLCDPGWVGELCQLLACPDDCLGNGECSDTLQQCVCFEGFTGSSCSIPVQSPHWELLNITVSDEALLSGLARAGHSAVVWEEDMIVYGGYRFPVGDEEEAPGGSGSDEADAPQLLRYSFASGRWEELTVSAPFGGSLPEPRHGHTAVVYNNSMYVFGGAKIPAEEITSELWVLDLVSLEWTDLSPVSNTTADNSSDSNATIPGVVSMETLQVSPQEGDYLPLPVRSHTAHVIGSTMVVLFGLTSDRLNLVGFVQEYDFETDTWSTPDQFGVNPGSRLGHSSVYHPGTGLIYVYGGQVTFGQSVGLNADLLTYDPLAHTWSRLEPSPSPRYLHSATLLGDLLLTFGGSTTTTNQLDDCYSSDLLLYNIACGEWQQMDYPGLPGSSSRYGHSALLDPTDPSLLVFGGFFGLLHGDLLRLDPGNCSSYPTRDECLNGSQLCAWILGGRCVLSGVEGEGELSYQCEADLCLSHRSCDDCVTASGCRYNRQQRRCMASNDNSTQECQEEGIGCGRYGSCESCHSHTCQWNDSGNTCASLEGPDEPGNCSVSSPSCYAHTTCGGCTSASCLWCPALQQCIPGSAYYFTYSYGQCLGWVSRPGSCLGDCPAHQNCTTCGNTIGCGWCNDPSDTGLGVCAEGGFTESRNSSFCDQDSWYFDQCPACQCNGHSSCVNSTICEECQSNTTGEHCQECSDGFFGIPLNGNTCSLCDCNGYNPICNNRNGTCDCLDIGVTGNGCDTCNANNLYIGDANNFCFYPLQVGFVYTLGVSDQGTQTFYLAVPTDNKKLSFEFDITANPLLQTITLQLFLGRRSENYWVLANITDPIEIQGVGGYSRDLDDFGSNPDPSLAQLFTFARPSLLSNPNFTALFEARAENDYTRHMWNGDVALVIYVYNLADPMTFKITLEQMDLIFLLYFFATFVSCFTVLLVGFLTVWYIKRKLQRRALVRQQYIELQRRVRRPFSRVKLVVNQRQEQDTPQFPSYAGVETCRDNRAAVLSLFVRLPGDNKTGRPVPGRTGICCGSTLVKVNPSKGKQKKRERERGRGGSASSEPEEHS